ncbi:AbfB domain-containing protein [Streptomyces mangrovisoli]|uniref:Alpha-L-arabinofuranosidase B arabinose-binding domain-containing protein n=1 Tax=Streptomyces mangrovisoli TaxID=1428628 RepID=A0A1J4NL89_9ACTN|nr:AbfB domain-containing protein [Streptomyces mangrovisoli]OIJ62938.1 hypothetical protein WN71_036735 [Streptomyces mangrovisoli]
MPDRPALPPSNRPWDGGWPPDTSRTPGTRRLWLAGALALATACACVTAVGLGSRDPDVSSSPAARATGQLDAGPGLLSFASPSAAEAERPATVDRSASAKAGKRDGSSSPTPSARTSASADPSKSGGSKGGAATSPSTTRWVSVRSVNYPDRYWKVSDGRVELDPLGSAAARRAATFKLVKGLADSSCYSFVTADGSYLRHRDFVLRAERDDGSRLFEQDATFCSHPASASGAVTLESVNYPDRFLRHRDFQLKLETRQSGELYGEDSAFRLVAGVS